MNDPDWPVDGKDISRETLSKASESSSNQLTFNTTTQAQPQATVEDETRTNPIIRENDRRPLGMSEEEHARINAMLAQDEFTHTTVFSTDNDTAMRAILKNVDKELTSVKNEIGALERLVEDRTKNSDKRSEAYKDAVKPFMLVKKAHMEFLLAVLKMRQGVKVNSESEWGEGEGERWARQKRWGADP